MKKNILTIIIGLFFISCSVDMIEIKNKKQSIKEEKIGKLRFDLIKQKEKLKNIKIEIKLTKKDLIILNKGLELYSKNIDMDNSFKKMLALDIEKIRTGFTSKGKQLKSKKSDLKDDVEFQRGNKLEPAIYKGKAFFFSHNKNIKAGSIYVQIGAFATASFADNYKRKAISNGFENTQIIESLYHLVLVGKYDNFESAYDAKKRLQKIGFSDAYIKKYR